MPFWTDAKVEPKRSYRFAMTFGGAELQQIEFAVMKVNKPEITIEPKTHNYLNHEFHYPGRPKWNAVAATLVDPVDPDVSYKFSKVLEQAGYIVPNNTGEVTTISKAAAATTLGNVVITQYGPSRTQAPNSTVPPLVDTGLYDSNGKDHIIEQWTLHNPFITKVNFGELDYANEDLVQIQVEFRYDWATIQGNDVGTKVWPLGNS